MAKQNIRQLQPIMNLLTSKKDEEKKLGTNKKRLSLNGEPILLSISLYILFGFIQISKKQLDS